jgi:DNA primase
MSGPSADLVYLVGTYISLTETRRGFRGKCPFHAEVAESLLISAEKSFFKCFVCGMEGGPEEFKPAIALFIA